MNATPSTAVPPSPATVATLRGLTKTFRDFWGRPTVRAVAGLDLELTRGQVLGLLGPNGSGKSTTIKILLGLLFPTSGHVDVLGHSPRHVATKRLIGYMPEDAQLYRHLTPRETLDFFGRLFGLPRAIRRERTEQLLAMAGLSHAANRPVGGFSKGMTRRVGLAQALINDPRLLVLDEPTAGLDPQGCRQVKDMIAALARRGTTVLLTSHLLADVEDVCDSVAILYNGRIRARGGVRALLTVPGSVRIGLPDLPPERMQQVLAVLREWAGTEPQVERPALDLEQFFLRVMAEAGEADSPQAGSVSIGHLAPFLVAPDRGEG